MQLLCTISLSDGFFYIKRSTATEKSIWKKKINIKINNDQVFSVIKIWSHFFSIKTQLNSILLEKYK